MAALVLGVGAMFFALIPIIGFFSVPFALVGLALGIAGRSRATRGYEGGGMAITGIITSVVALGISVLYVVAISTGGDNDNDNSGSGSTGVERTSESSSESSSDSDSDSSSDVTDESGGLGSREQPLAFGEAHDIGDGWTVRVAEFDPDANAAVAEANMFNDPPPEGYGYVLVKPAATYSGDAEMASTFDLTFRLVGASGVTIERRNANCVPPDPSWRRLGDVFPGGTLEGYECFQVPLDDLDSIVLIAEPTLAFSGTRAYLALR